MILGAVALSGILAPLNSTMLAVALPRIIEDFHASVGTAGWLMTSYLLACSIWPGGRREKLLLANGVMAHLVSRKASAP